MGEHTMPLREAVERFRREPGSASNSYDWYRQQAHRSGEVWMGDRPQLAGSASATISVLKIGRSWMVDPDELDKRLAEHRTARAERQRITDDYDRHILHGRPGTTLHTGFGSYTVGIDFHVVYYNSVDKYSGSWPHWRCSRCWEEATTEREKPECHTCSDWGSCGRDCRLSRVLCIRCGTSLDL